MEGEGKCQTTCSSSSLVKIKPSLSPTSTEAIKTRENPANKPKRICLSCVGCMLSKRIAVTLHIVNLYGSLTPKNNLFLIKNHQCSRQPSLLSNTQSSTMKIQPSLKLSSLKLMSLDMLIKQSKNTKDKNKSMSIIIIRHILKKSKFRPNMKSHYKKSINLRKKQLQNMITLEVEREKWMKIGSPKY